MTELPDHGETLAERADRNWSELTQELRVTQTGVQILTAFLLILPFQQRFTDITVGQRTLYLVLISLALITTILMVAPVSLHRALFHRGRKARIVHIANRITVTALVFLGLTIVGTVAFVFNVVVGIFAMWIAVSLTVVLIVSMWLFLPWRARITADPYPEQ